MTLLQIGSLNLAMMLKTQLLLENDSTLLLKEQKPTEIKKYNQFKLNQRNYSNVVFNKLE
jgi:hypothetical protein